MIATLQKQHPHHSLMSSTAPAFLHHHRRNPSAPTLLTVAPTGTRGLLALSKPKQLVKQPQPSSSKSHPRLAPIVSLTDTTAPPTPAADSPALLQRGRKPKAPTPAATTPKAKRSASHQAITRRHHQPDPEPTKTPEPKEQLPKAEPQTSPRKRPAQHQRHNTAPPSPVVLLQKPPVGRGTRAGRRERHKSSPANDSAVAAAAVVAAAEAPAPPAAQPASPVLLPLAPAAAITMPPRPKKDLQGLLSRSAPLEHGVRKLQLPFMLGDNPHALSDWDLPAALASPRPTITLNTQDPSWLISGPRTAPLDKSPRFPSYSPPTTPTPAGGHARNPSFPAMGMFSFDDADADAIAIPSGTRSADVSPLRFSRSQSAAMAALTKKQKEDMWAASSFQTGPTLRQLPAPGL